MTRRFVLPTRSSRRLRFRILAAGALVLAGCAGDTEGLAPTTPGDPAFDATTDGTTTLEEGVVLEDTFDAGIEIMPLDTASDDAGDDTPDAVMDSIVAETTTDAPMDGDAKVCMPALTTSTKGACDSVIQSWPDEGANHHEPGTALNYCTSPPSSGDHYSLWASYRVYDKPVPYGYLVHSLEHGGVIVLYKCASGSCPTVQSEIVAIVNARPVDPLCTDPTKRRVIVAPDPTLDVAVGASAWGWTYRASCVHAASLGKFIDDHYAKASEDTCADGVVPP